MAMFNRNALPEEFQAEHGSIDLQDSPSSSSSLKPNAAALEDRQEEDQDLDLARAGQCVWLCKVPRFLLDKWQQSSREGEILGRVRVYDEKTPDGNAKISVLLNEHNASASASEAKPDLKAKRPPDDGLPTEYKLTMQNTASKNLYVFGEKVEDDLDSGEEGARKKRRITSLLGTVAHECSLTPVLSSPSASAAYARIMRERHRKAAEPRRTLKRLEVDDATANRLASGVGVGGIKARAATFANTTNKRTKGATNAAGQPITTTTPRATRMDKPALLDALISHFHSAPYWALKSLNQHVQQPQMYLRECLSEIATLVPKGPYANMWTLKPEFKGSGSGAAAAVAGTGTGGGKLGGGAGSSSGLESASGAVGREGEEEQDVKLSMTSGGGGGGGGGGVKKEEGDPSLADDDGDDDDDDDDLEMVS